MTCQEELYRLTLTLTVCGDVVIGTSGRNSHSRRRRWRQLLRYW